MFPFPRAASLLLLLVALAGARAQVSSGAAASPAGRISGKVVDAHSGQAVARCVVAVDATRQFGPSRSMMTGEDGQFSVDGLPVGKYQLRAARRGYLSQSYQEHDIFSTAIAVGPHLQSENLIFQLMPQSIVYGLVTDEAGEGIRRAQVQLFEDRGRDGIRMTQQIKNVGTDDRGMYEMANVSPGNYYLAVSAQPWYAHGAFSQSGPGSTASDLSLDLAYPVTYYPNATDTDEALPIPIKAGERTEVNVTLNPQHAMRIHLPVEKIEGASFSVAVQQSVFGQMAPVSVATQNTVNGVLEIEGLLPGHYDFTLTQSGPGPSTPGETHFTADVATGETELREQITIETVTVAGKISVPEGPTPSGGVYLNSSRPRRSYYAPLDAAGGFSLSVAPGEYEVAGNLSRLYLAGVSSPDAEVHGRMLTVKAGTAPRLELIAGSGFGNIDGIAITGGHGSGGAMVLLAPVDAKNNQILFRRDQSDSDGTFSLFDILPGRYNLLAIDRGWDLEWTDPRVLSRFLKKSVPIQIHANQKLQESVEVQER